MFGAIAEGTTHVTGFLEGEDALATLQAFRDMGVSIEGFYGVDAAVWPGQDQRCASSAHDRPITRVSRPWARAQMAGMLPPWRTELSRLWSKCDSRTACWSASRRDCTRVPGLLGLPQPALLHGNAQAGGHRTGVPQGIEGLAHVQLRSGSGTGLQRCGGGGLLHRVATLPGRCAKASSRCGLAARMKVLKPASRYSARRSAIF